MEPSHAWSFHSAIIAVDISSCSTGVAKYSCRPFAVYWLQMFFFSLSLCSYICVYWMTPDGIVPLDVCLAVSGFVCGPIFARRLFGLELIADELL